MGWKAAYLGAAPVAALGVVLLGATLGKTAMARGGVSTWIASGERCAGGSLVRSTDRNHWGMGRFCLAALARMTLVLNDLLEGISLITTGDGQQSARRSVRGCWALLSWCQRGEIASGSVGDGLSVGCWSELDWAGGAERPASGGLRRSKHKFTRPAGRTTEQIERAAIRSFE